MVADTGASLKDDEIELELSLSIGRSYERPKENGLLNSLKPDDNQPVVFGENDRRSSVSPTFNTTQMEITKREIQALRRLEAKRKREEKQLLKRGLFCNGVSCNGDLGFSKKSKVGNGCVNSGLKDVNLNLTAEQNDSAFNNGHAQVNAFGSPCREGNAAPFTPGHWFAGVGPGNVLRPLAGYGGGIGMFNAVSGSARVADSNREGSSGKSGSSGSPDSTPSAGSDRKRSPSREGGNSCETKSRSELDQPHSNDIKSECELGAASQQVVPAAAVEETYQPEKTNAYPSTPTGPKMEAAISEKALDSTTQNHFSTTENPTHGRPMKHCNGDKGKPPKPQTRNRDTSSLPRMPCVSTTGTGPNGKTVNGFLYRYTKTEVSIICVCHGTSFSPAEFVQHAGGVDVSNPLKHITVIPAPL